MTIVEQFNVLANLAKKVSVAELSVEMQDTIFKAQGLAMELQDRNYVLQSDNTKLKDQIKELQRTDDIEKELLPTKEGALFYRKDKKLYCSTCWGAEKKLTLLVRRSAGTRHGYCNNCKGDFPNAMGRFKTEDNL